MSATLTRDPLLTSISFIAGHDPVIVPPANERHQPLAYLYSEFEGAATVPTFGDFDEESQTWIMPPGFPTAGISTYTRTSTCSGTDNCWDDNCG